MAKTSTTGEPKQAADDKPATVADARSAVLQAVVDAARGGAPKDAVRYAEAYAWLRDSGTQRNK